MEEKHSQRGPVNPDITAIKHIVHAANKCSTGHEEPKPVQTAEGMVLQSVAQSMAIGIQDATDLMRNIGAVETAAIGTATAKWIQEPQNTLYQQIIDHSVSVLESASEVFKNLGYTAGDVLENFPAPISDTIFNEELSTPKAHE